MLIFHKGHTDTIQVYSVTVMIHFKALQAGNSSQGTSEPITPVLGGSSGSLRIIPIILAIHLNKFIGQQTQLMFGLMWPGKI